MMTINTERMIGLSDLIVVDHNLKLQSEISVSDILSLTPSTGRESGFCFYDKRNQDNLICHINITHKRGRFEVSYGTEESFRENGYMTEALEGFCKWLFINTYEKIIWALPNGQYKEASIAVLKKCGFEKADKEFGINWYKLKRGKP